MCKRWLWLFAVHESSGPGSSNTISRLRHGGGYVIKGLIRSFTSFGPGALDVTEDFFVL